MGDLILLASRRDDRSRPSRSSRPALFFDLASPLCYLAAARVERVLRDIDWVPVEESAIWGQERDRPGSATLREADIVAEAERCAQTWRLPLEWPERFPGPVPGAMRAAVYAAEVGAGARFALAASRLAFCGGFDLEDPEILAEAAAAAGLRLDDVLAATAEERYDAPLAATALGLRRRGVGRLPAIRVGRTILSGEDPVATAVLALRSPVRGGPLAPLA